MACPRHAAASTGIAKNSTVAKTFVDTNAFVYALDRGDPLKHDRARELIAALSLRSELVVSTQVVQEFFRAATRKLGHDPLAVKAVVQQFSSFEIVQVDFTLIVAAIDLSILHPLSFWDAMIIAAAREARCTRVLTEDLQHGLVIEGVRVENPFPS